MRIKYPHRSDFLKPCEDAIRTIRDALLAGAPIVVHLSRKGYPAKINVTIRKTDWVTFEAQWQSTDPSRFPQRVKAAAWALHRRMCSGDFLIKHRAGVLTIQEVMEKPTPIAPPQNPLSPPSKESVPVRSSHPRTSKALLEYAQLIDPASLFPALEPAASDLIATDPYAFTLATCLDRGAKAELIWTIPYYIKQDLGHLDPYRIHQMSLEALARLFSRLPKRPRYINAAPRTTQESTTLVIQQFEGDASLIWKNRRAAEVNRTFQSIYGVGLGIANMAVILIEKGFGIRFSDLDHTTMDIKPDTHTMRVLYRLGASPSETEQAAIQAARALRPEYPGEIDGPLWIIGRTWCDPSSPNCHDCPVGEVCAKPGTQS